MTLTDRITRAPRAFDPDRGQEAHALVPGVAKDLGAVIAAAGGSSPYLQGLIAQEAAWLPEAFEDPEAAAQVICDQTRTGPGAAGKHLRHLKRRIALLTALMDLGGIWTLEEVTGWLSRFADAACQAALEVSLAPLIARGKLPGVTEDDLSEGAGMVVLGMGKLGAGELNYSSDIDLICLFDQDRFDPDDFLEARAGFVKATRAMAKLLSDLTADGYVFRTDLRLRPDPAVTPVCLAMETAERYYESVGRTWERAAYIKARPMAGDMAAGARFLSALTPFVWRKHLDFAAIEDAHNMRLAIREHKGLGGPITLPGHDMKLGRGGIREIEFFTQTRQLIAGGRDASLRVRGTVEGLQRLAAKGWVPENTAADLSDHYRFHRMVEHRVQMVRDAQTHTLPTSAEGFDRLACLMGQDADALKTELEARLTSVHSDTEGFFAPQSREEPAQTLLDDARRTRWLTYPALRSPRARALLDRLRPELEARLADAARPEEALSALESFLGGLPAGVQLLSLFEANPHLIDLVLDVVATSPALASYLARNSKVLDAVIGGDFFADWPGASGLMDDLQAQLQDVAGDYEGILDATRRWQKEWHFRIGVHLLRDLIDAEEAGQHYADLAHVVIQGLWPHVQADFARRHGPVPGRGAVILGMGAVAAGRMHARSDLDLIVIYDAGDIEASDGPRPLATRPYFARLTQALITALSAPMSEGRLYEVDLRLRPSGNKGPVATSWGSFQSYQTEDAWTWEHLALTRAAVITGPQALGADVLAFRAALLGKPRDAVGIATDVADMRRRIATAKPSKGWLDIKAGPGRMQDIELLAQTGALLTGQATHTVLSGLEALELDAADTLAALHGRYWRLQVAGRLLADELVDDAQLGQGARDFLARATGTESLEALQKTLGDAKIEADEQISATVIRLQGKTHGDQEG